MSSARSRRPEISVIIPTFRAWDCLRISLTEFLRCPGLEVIIGLDGAPSSYLAYLRDRPVKVVALKRRQGAATATNLAAAQARGRFLLLANDDMVPGPGAVEVMRDMAGEDKIVSALCWEPGLIPAPACHRIRNFGGHPQEFRLEEFRKAVQENHESEMEPGINYPFLIPTELWKKVGGLDERFEPGSASDPDLFIRLALQEPRPAMLRTRRAVFYHFASRSSIYAGGRLSLLWKLHRRHGRLMFQHKWGRMWDHDFGQVPDPTAWRDLRPRPEPAFWGRLWRKLWFGNFPGYEVWTGAGR